MARLRVPASPTRSPTKKQGKSNAARSVREIDMKNEQTYTMNSALSIQGTEKNNGIDMRVWEEWGAMIRADIEEWVNGEDGEDGCEPYVDHTVPCSSSVTESLDSDTMAALDEYVNGEDECGDMVWRGTLVGQKELECSKLPKALDSATKLVLKNWINEESEDEHVSRQGHYDYLQYNGPSEVEPSNVVHNIENNLTGLSEDVVPEQKATETSIFTSTLRNVCLTRGSGIRPRTRPIAGTETRDFAFDPFTDADSDDNDDIGTICRKINSKLSKHSYFSFIGDIQHGEQKNSSTTPPNSIARRSPSFSPQEATDIPYPFVSPPRSKTAPRRCSNQEPRITLIACADSSPLPPEMLRRKSISPFSPLQRTNTLSFGRNPCYDPGFPGHSPCATHEEGWYGRSADDALEMMRERFEILHYADEDTGYVKEWKKAKEELGMGMVMVMMHGGSRLRWVEGINEDGLEKGSNFEEDVGDECFEDEVEVTSSKNEPLKDNDVDDEDTDNSAVGIWLHQACRGLIEYEAPVRIKHSNNELRKPVIGSSPPGPSPSPALYHHSDKLHMHTTPSKDTLGAKSSARPSIFSKRTSFTSESSCETNPLNIPQNNCFPHTDALDLETDAHECEKGWGGNATLSRSVSDGSMISSKHTRHGSVPFVSAKEWSLRLVQTDSDGATISEVDAQPSPGSTRQCEAVSDTPECHERCVGGYPGLVTAEQVGEEVARLSVHLLEVAGNEELSSPGVFESLGPGIPLRELYVELNNDVSTGNSQPMEDDVQQGEALDQPRCCWAVRMKNGFTKLPRKVQQVTRRCVEAVKQVSKTAWGFIPAALSRRHPFRKA